MCSRRSVAELQASAWQAGRETQSLPFACNPCTSAPLHQDSELATMRPGFVDISCCDRAQFRSWPSEKVFRAVDVLAAAARRVSLGEMTKGDYDDMELATGLNRNPLGVFASAALRSTGHQRQGTQCCNNFGCPHPSCLARGPLSVRLASWVSRW